MPAFFPIGSVFTVSRVKNLLLRHPLHVDERRFTGDGNGFGELADAEIGIDSRDKAGRELDAFAPDRPEPCNVKVTE
jgi:hypothetical protein